MQGKNSSGKILKLNIVRILIMPIIKVQQIIMYRHFRQAYLSF